MMTCCCDTQRVFEILRSGLDVASDRVRGGWRVARFGREVRPCTAPRPLSPRSRCYADPRVVDPKQKNLAGGDGAPPPPAPPLRLTWLT